MVDVLMPWFLPRQTPVPMAREPQDAAQQRESGDGHPADAPAEKPAREPAEYPGYFLG